MYCETAAEEGKIGMRRWKGQGEKLQSLSLHTGGHGSERTTIVVDTRPSLNVKKKRISQTFTLALITIWRYAKELNTNRPIK